MYIVFIMLTGLIPLSSFAGEFRVETNVNQKQFFQNYKYEEQQNNYLNSSFRIEYFHDWLDKKQRVSLLSTVTLLEHADKTGYADIDELVWLTYNDWSDLSIGVKKVFWGVVESRHLVDIINQTDLLLDDTGEKKLGQPMMNYKLKYNNTALDLFVLPYFMERRFADVYTRPRSKSVIDDDNIEYQSSKKRNHVDYAMRLSGFMGGLDYAFSYFNGTDRIPNLSPVTVTGENGEEDNILRQTYKQTEQIGLELQYTYYWMLFKLEYLHKETSASSYDASIFGIEYQLPNIISNKVDISVLLEYLYDERGQKFDSLANDDYFYAIRFSGNDVSSTSLLVGALVDSQSDDRVYRLEGSRRLSENWTINLDGQFYSSDSEQGSLVDISHDSYVQFTLKYYL